MSVSIHKVAVALFALMCVVALSGTVVHAQEFEDFDEFDILLDEADFSDSDFDEFDFSEDAIGIDEEYFNEEFDFIEGGLRNEDELRALDDGFFDGDGPVLFDDEDFVGDFEDDDILYGDELDFADDGDFFDSYEPFDAPQWEEVRALVELQDESDVLWDAVLPDVETGEVHLFGTESKALFGLFDIDMTVSRMLDAEGVLSEIDRPWYAFLLW